MEATTTGVGYSAHELLKMTSGGRGTGMASTGTNASRAGVLSASRLQQLRGNTTVMSMEDYQKAKASANSEHKTLEQTRMDTESFQRQREAVAEERRHIFETREIKKPYVMTETEREAQEQANALRERAKRARDLEEDFVKTLNSLSANAKASSERKKQLELHAAAVHVAHREKEEEAAQLRENQARWKEETRRKEQEDAIRAAKEGELLRLQISEKEERAKLDRELKLQEAIREKERIAQALKEERQAELDHVALEHSLVEESKRINALTMEIRRKQHEEEVEADRRLAEFLAKKAEEDERREKMEQERRAERDRIAFILGNKQKRQADHMSAVEERNILRAKEAEDRRYRANQLAQAQKQAKMREELRTGLDAQIREREERERALDADKQAEYQRALENKRLYESGKEKELHSVRRRMITQRTALNEQLEAKKRLEGSDPMMVIGRADEAERIQRLERLKQERLAELRAQGVREEDLYDIKKLRVF